MLTVKEIKHAKPGMHADGSGLYLRVQKSGAKSWIFRFQLKGHRREMGLGILEDLSVVEARAEVAVLSKLVREGVDPIEDRKLKQKNALNNATKSIPTFREISLEYIENREDGWKNEKHKQQWRNTLATYCASFNEKLVSEVTIDDVEAALRPIWLEKNETASRVLNRIIRVTSHAYDKELRMDDASSWSKRILQRLPRVKKSERVVHQPALPYTQMPLFMQEVHKKLGMGARALEFAILCASRSGEVRLATWGEINLDKCQWTIPAQRMKMKKIHIVTLSSQAVRLLESIRPKNAKSTDYIFPGQKDGRPMSDMTISAVIRRDNKWFDEHGRLVVPHGFRSSFDDWASEQTNHDSNVIDMSMSHAIANPTKRAYRRGKLIEKRQNLMQDWADYCYQNISE